MRLRGLIAVAVGVLVAIGAPTALGDPRYPGGTADPQTTNVPHTAWAGQTLRLVKCFSPRVTRTNEEISGLDLPSLTGNFVTEDWSGDFNPHSGPKWLSGNSSAFATDAVPFLSWRNDRPSICFAANVVSLKPGLAVIKLALNAPVRTTLFDFFDGVAETTVHEHQFLAIWMLMQKPSIEELPYGGDARVLNHFFLDESTVPGRVRVTVKGTFPFAGGTLTLPDQWETLANSAAFDKWNPVPGSAAMRWDIHDDNAPPPNPLQDVVSLSPFGAFDTIHGNTSNNVIGPFDPNFPFDTLLSDGALNWYDAPMPAARVDVSIKKNSGNNGDISGAGKLVTVHKSDVYQTGPEPVFHAPFYSQYIPATSRAIDASGTHGGYDYGNNFPTAFKAPYRNWYAHDTNAPRTDGSYRCKNELGYFRPAPNENKPQGGHVIVFTDEHGEAIVGFDPDAGFYHVIDVNNRCDLDRLPNKLIGTAEIRAQGIYPGQPVIGAPATLSDPLVKSIYHGASKTLNCIPKSPIESFCVETIKDIYGKPVSGALVEFSRTPISRGIAPAALAFGGYDTRGQYFVDSDLGVVRIKTNHLGQAGVEISHTPKEKVDVLAENKGTRNGGFGVLRAYCIQFYGDGVTMPTGAATCETPPVPAAPVAPGVGGVGAGAIVIGGPVKVGYGKPNGSKKWIAWTKFVNTKQGKRIQLKLNGPKNATGLVRIKLLGSKGKVMKVVHRRVKTGKAVTLDVKLVGAKKVSVSLVS